MASVSYHGAPLGVSGGACGCGGDLADGALVGVSSTVGCLGVLCCDLVVGSLLRPLLASSGVVVSDVSSIGPNDDALDAYELAVAVSARWLLVMFRLLLYGGCACSGAGSGSSLGSSMVDPVKGCADASFALVEGSGTIMSHCINYTMSKHLTIGVPSTMWILVCAGRSENPYTSRRKFGLSAVGSSCAS